MREKIFSHVGQYPRILIGIFEEEISEYGIISKNLNQYFPNGNIVKHRIMSISLDLYFDESGFQVWDTIHELNFVLVSNLHFLLCSYAFLVFLFNCSSA